MKMSFELRATGCEQPQPGSPAGLVLAPLGWRTGLARSAKLEARTEYANEM